MEGTLVGLRKELGVLVSHVQRVWPGGGGGGEVALCKYALVCVCEFFLLNSLYLSHSFGSYIFCFYLTSQVFVLSQ